MICNPCIKTKTLPRCITSLNIGTISDINSAVNVYIKNVTVGSSLAIQATSDGSGDIILDTSGICFIPEHAYLIWVTDNTAGYEERLNVSVDGESGETICVRFEKVIGEDGEEEQFLTQTILAA